MSSDEVAEAPEIQEVESNKSIIMNDYNDYDMDHVVNEELTKIRQSPCVIQAHVQLNGYIKLNKALKNELKPYKRALDTKYKRLSHLLNFLQISIIIFSTCSGFLQATKSHTGLSDEVNSFIGIFVSTYTGLLLSLIKYNKWDEKKEQINNLKEKFAEFIVEIERMNDVLNYWKSDSFWGGGIMEEREKRWKDECKKIDENIDPTIQKKQTLVCEYEQVMDKTEVDILNIRERTLDKKIKEKQINLAANELEMKRLEDIAKFEEQKQEIIYNEVMKLMKQASTSTDKRLLRYNFHQMERRVKGKEVSETILTIPGTKMLKKLSTVFQKDDEEEETEKPEV